MSDAAASPPRLDEIRRTHLSSLIERIVLVRLVVSPAFAAVALWVITLDAAPWRRAILALAAATLGTISVVELVRFRRHGLRPRTVPLNLSVGAVAQAALVFATGGLRSPLLPGMVLVAGLVGVLLPLANARAVVALQVAAVWLMAIVRAKGWISDFVPSFFAEPSLDRAQLWSATVFMTPMLLAGLVLGGRIRRAFEDMLVSALETRDDYLRLHAEQIETLMKLSGEIAHELKNPLATVKGLGSLVAKELEGKPAERMGVLRREVDRMQGILDEFLDFSRPLVPLTQEPVDLAELCTDVAELHEGMAADRQVSIRTHAQGAGPVRCDRRKIQQVLINLVQNALDASPRGAEVSVTVAPEPGKRVRVSVRDRGAGLSAELAERAFDPGVTTKARGSGLGLTVARALVRQHGGELELHAVASGDGCVAEMVLPTEGCAA